MTTEQIRFDMEAVYSAVLEQHGAKPKQEVPANVTPLAWHEVIKPDTDLGARAEGMAMAGLYYGCTHFARLRVQDRDEARVRGHMKTHKRERALIVHALGWRTD